jgi:porphobilinogen synthase
MLQELLEMPPFSEITKRPRRLRKNRPLRALVEETHLLPQHLVTPLFIVDGEKQKIAIPSMPGVFRLSLDEAAKEIEACQKLGLFCYNLFCYTPDDKKDLTGSEAWKEDNLLARSLKFLKKEFPNILLMADIALDPFTSHGHDGLVDEEGVVVNDATIHALVKMSLHAASAGCDVLSPSDMMDGRVGCIRRALDKENFHNVAILSYAVKHASALYGPFRDALSSSPKFGDKKNYQMNPANRRDAIRECLLDEEEGADMLLIKPALSNLDIIFAAKQHSNLPIGAYQVSGEYAMIEAASQKDWIDGDKVLLESLTAIRRAGADFILSYGAKKAAQLTREQLGLT